VINFLADTIRSVMLGLFIHVIYNLLVQKLIVLASHGIQYF